MELIKVTTRAILLLSTGLILNYFAVASIKRKCGLYKEVIQTEKAAIVLLKCRGRGSDNLDKNNQCVADSKETVHTNYTNHTSCRMACVCPNDGGCGKLKLEAGLVECREGLTWSKNNCKCEPKCGKTCVPDIKKGQKVLGKKDSTSININVYIVSMVGEFILVVAISYCIFGKKICRNNAPRNNDIEFTEHQNSHTQIESPTFERKENPIIQNGHLPEEHAELLENKPERNANDQS